MHKNLLVSFILLFNIIVYSQEFRGVWVASVANLDWPASNNLSVEQQKESLKNLFTEIAKLNFNAVVFQVRPECDALYKSPFEPWSYWLTGEQGKEPVPFYDPLEYAIKTAHDLGLELHAWINPYRAERKAGLYKTAPNHITNLHPDWIIQIGDYKFLNPGLKEVRSYVVNVVKDIVSRYDIDGIHLDDYFYPYIPNEISSEDSATFVQNSRGFNSISDWRRDNVNLLLDSLYTSIKSIKPFVRFGVSPFGIYKAGEPEGIVGYSAYDKIYCDPKEWVKNKSVDYLAPQLYWEFGGQQDFALLSQWWNSNLNGIDIFPGIAVYKIFTKNWRGEEITSQIRYTRQLSNAKGTILFRALNVIQNPESIADSLKLSLFNEKVLPPAFYSKVIPSPPVFAFYKLIDDSTIEIHNLSNYTGKFGVYDHNLNLLSLSYNSILRMKTPPTDSFYIKNISRFDAVNGKSTKFEVDLADHDVEILSPKVEDSFKNGKIPLAFSLRDYRFSIIEIAKDKLFFDGLQIKFHSPTSAIVQFNGEIKGKYYIKISIVLSSGKIVEFDPYQVYFE